MENVNSAIKAQIEKQFGKIGDVQLEDNQCCDEDGEFIDYPLFTFYTELGRVMVETNYEITEIRWAENIGHATYEDHEEKTDGLTLADLRS